MTSIAQVDPTVNRSLVRPNSNASLATNQQLFASSKQPLICPSNKSVQPDDVCEPSLPAHLGGESQRLSAALHVYPPVEASVQEVTNQVPPTSLKPAETHDISREVRVLPSILLGMLREQQTATGRIWLICRHLDDQGRGWLSADALRDALCKKGESMRVCGWRRMRQILAAGDGIFWQRDTTGRIWLRSAEKVAAALHVKHLSGLAILLPVKVLTGRIHLVRAHFFAAYHSGRRNSMPISRATLHSFSGVAERTQRKYDRVAKTTRKDNFAVGVQYSAELRQGHAYKRRYGGFIFTDRQGTQGKVGQKYFAWRLPNSYQGIHQTESHGRQKKINSQLKQQFADLVTYRAQGNDELVKPTRLFFDGNRVRPNTYHDTYLYDRQQKLWFVMEPKLK
ncbi:MAG: hypothetical protein ACPG8W_12030 [Candidatus Promineifilaceae bacterium]